MYELASYSGERFDIMRVRLRLSSISAFTSNQLTKLKKKMSIFLLRQCIMYCRPMNEKQTINIDYYR